MARGATVPEDDAAAPAPPKGTPTREKLKAFLVRRYSTRLHMSLILASCGLVAMSTSWSLLHLGVRSMLLRYPVAMVMAYATFLIGVWVWLRATGLLGNAARGDPGNARKAKSSTGDWVGDISTGGSGGSSGGGGGGGGSGASIARGGGGSFDGGGASASFAEGRAPLIAASMQQQSAADAAVPRSGSSSTSSSKSGGGSGLSIDIDGDGIVLLILAGVLVLAVFATSGYLIWCAPDVLTEAAFGAALTGTLARPAKAHSASGWVEGVVKKTWWPFAVVLLVAMAFAGWCSVHYPGASTFRQAIVMAIHNDH